MNNISKNFIDEEGKGNTVIAESNDGYKVNLNNNYSLVKPAGMKANKLTEKFKSSILGTDIGIKSGGFTSVAILATVIALAAFVIIYFAIKV